MTTLNYATEYSRLLSQVFPYVLKFGHLYATPNNGRYRVINAKTIQIPRLSVGGRTDANRDTVGSINRNYDNDWETKTLSNQRKWDTLVHPADIDQTNYVASIENITTTMNNEQKFPEMDAYTISKIWADWIDLGYAPDHVTLSISNVLATFDKLMKRMDERRVPSAGRILYVIPDVAELLKQAQGITRNFNVQAGGGEINRIVTGLDNVTIENVSSELMKTAYDFTTGWAPGASAKQILMALVHPLAVITPVSYEFAQLDAPSAGSQGKWVYYEESFEDVFILNKKADGIQFVVGDNITADALTVSSAASVKTGAVNGDSTISCTAKAAGNTNAYKIASATITVPNLGDEVEGYTAWNGSDDVNGTAGHYIRIVELNPDGKVVATGETTLTVKS